MESIGLYVLAALAILGGFELFRWALPDRNKLNKERPFDPTNRYDSSSIAVSLGIGLMVFGGFAIYGGTQGWSFMQIVSYVGNIM